MPDLSYEELAEQWAYIAALIQRASQDADRLHVPIPQALARANADVLTFPAMIREVGQRRDAPWVELQRHDEPEGP